MNARPLELPCPKCGGINRVHAEHVPDSGEFPCAYCSEAIAFDTPVTGPAAPAAPASPSRPEHQTLIRLDDWPEDRDADPGEVACPACGHRFTPDAARAARTTILVVEDTEFFSQLAIDVLGARYRTLVAHSAAEARQVLAVEPVDLVVLDLGLPDGDGQDVLRALPRPGIPVLVFTSKDETALVGREWAKLQALGAHDVVHKGINVEETLLRKVGELLGEPVPVG